MPDSFDAIGVWTQALLTNRFIALTLGGTLGTHARYWLDRWISTAAWSRGFPWGTLVVNLSGSFLLGLVGMFVLERLPSSQRGWYLLMGSGFCGAFTTFSTFEWQTFRLVRDGNWWFALLNVTGNVLLGLAGIALAVLLVGTLVPRR